MQEGRIGSGFDLPVRAQRILEASHMVGGLGVPEMLMILFIALFASYLWL